jgi:hypothetical protein
MKLINVAIVVLAVAGGIALSQKPWKVYKEQRKLADEARAEMQVSEARREELVREDAKYKTSIGREELARRKGYRKPGELPLK